MKTIKILVFILLSVLGEYNLDAQYTKLFDFTLDKSLNRPWYSDFVTDGTFLYSLTQDGGANNLGALFKISLDGTGYQKLLDFNGDNGKWPCGSVIISGNMLYGMTWYGGTNNDGVIFKIKTDGTGYQKLYDFKKSDSGTSPVNALLLSGSILYGMTSYGGSNSKGVIFKINTDGTSFQKLHEFGGADGDYPLSALIQSGSVLYGTTRYGGNYNNGVVFKINTDGSCYAKLYEFDNNSNGSQPCSGLNLSGSILYGTTIYGGASNKGVIFKISKDGTGFQKLYDFNGSKGSNPVGALVVSGSYMYGMTLYGGSANYGAAFRLNTDGTAYQTLYIFDKTSRGAYPYGAFLLVGSTLYATANYGSYGNAGLLFKVNTDGSGGRVIRHCYLPVNGGRPEGKLTTDNNVIYGTTRHGGINDKGTIYKINKDGSGFQTIYQFNCDINGHAPIAVTLCGNTLYGSACDGGANNLGVIFKINTDGSGYQKLLDFDGTNKGANPTGGELVLSNSYIYGVTQTGGTSNNGVVFKIKTDGTSYQKLLDFDGTNNGRFPSSALVVSGSSLYGTTYSGGANNFGTFFKLNTDGTGFQKLYDNITYTGALTLFGSNLYAMTLNGGTNSLGTIFKISTSGTNFQKLADFDGTNYGSGPYLTALTVVGSSLYGTTSYGGVNNAGVIFKIDPDGSNFQKVTDFTKASGINPLNTLTLVDNSLYGTTNAGGQDSIGVIYKYNLTNLQITATGGKLTCSVPKINVDVTSNISGVTYRWSGPGNFSSTIKNPQVSLPGNYIVTVTANGSSKIDTAKVTEDKAKPSLTLSSSGSLGCTASTVQLTARTTTPNCIVRILNDSTDAATLRVNVNNPGMYYAKTRSNVNGCVTRDSITVIRSADKPNLSIITPQALTCSITSVSLKAASTTPNTSITWAGYPAGQNPINVNTPGKYAVSATNSVNGCSSSDTAVVIKNVALPGASAYSGYITCADTIINVYASSPTANVTYKWSGPNGFISSQQNPLVNKPGTYTVTVTSNTNSCTSTASTTVSLYKVYPDVTTTNTQLTCSKPSDVVHAYSNTEGVSYQWYGPNGYNSSLQHITVNNPGLYIVKVIYSASGCATIDTSVVTSNKNVPDLNATGGNITCQDSIVTIKAITSTPNAIYNWSGPGNYTSTQPQNQVNKAGLYIITLTNPVNGCKAIDTAIVTGNPVKPDITTTGGNLTCTNTSIMLGASSNVSSATYQWTGPNGFTSALQNPATTKAGVYSVTVTSSVNGCKNNKTAIVTQDTVRPGVNAAGGNLTCINTSVILAASSNVGTATYQWTGPDGFASTLQNSPTAKAGVYSVTVTNPANGCKNNKTAIVTQDTVRPGINTTGGNLTCATTSITLGASSNIGTATYQWTGPNGYTSSLQNPTTAKAGVYSVTVTNPANGCKNNKTALVTADTLRPNLQISVSGNITCAVASVVLTASSSTPNTTFAWAGFTAGVNPITVSSAVKYYVTVTNTINSCTRRDSVKVIENKAKPGVIAQGGTLTCAVTSLILHASSPVNNVTYTWTGDNFYSNEQEPEVIFPGVYTVKVTNAINKCSSDTAVVVNLNNSNSECLINAPSSQPIGNSPNNTLSAQVVSGTSYSWEVTSANSTWQITANGNTPIVTYKAGTVGSSATFVLTVKKLETGCNKTCQITLNALAQGLRGAKQFTDLNDSLLGNMEIKVYPNPFSDEAYIEFIPAEDQKITILLYAPDGSEAQSLFNADVKKYQRYKTAINSKGLSDGVYMYLVKTPKKVYAGKIILQR